MKWFSIRDAAKPTGPVQILIYDQIGTDWYGDQGVSAKEFAEGLKTIDAKAEIEVLINSPGGNVWDGLAIFNQLRQRKQQVTCRVDGIAASIASIIALAGRKLVMPENSLLMIHDPMALVSGNSEELKAMAKRLDEHADLLAGIYAGKSGQSREKCREAMREETYFTGTAAHAFGLCDELSEPIAIAASIANFDFSKFRQPPELITPPQNKQPASSPRPSPPVGERENIMNKTAVLALLKQHGKTVADNATDEIILAALTELVTAGKLTQAQADKAKEPEQKPIILSPDQWAEITNELTLEKERRIRSELMAINATRPFIDVEEYLPICMKDEGELGRLRKLPEWTDQDAARGVRFASPVQNNGNPLIEKYRGMKAGAERGNFHIEHWNELQAAMEQHRVLQMSALPVSEQLRRLQQPRAVNSYGASLVTDFLSDEFITTIGQKLAAFQAFSRNFGTDRLKPRSTVQVSKATAGATTQTDPTNFESGDSTTTNVAIAVSQYSQCFNVTNDELNKGHTLRRVAAKNAQNFAFKLSDVWTDLLEIAAFGAATVIGAAANFDALDLAPIYALAKNYGEKNLVLDGGHLAYLLPTDKFKFRIGERGAYSFDLIVEQNRWTGALANTVGFICDPNAIAIGSGLPADLPASEFIELGTVEVAQLGLTAQVCHWFSRAGRVHWMSFDIMFGAKEGDTTAAEILVTA